MKDTQDYKFYVSVSTQKFDHKPNRETEVGKLRFNRIYTDIEGFADGIAKGYCYTSIFASAFFGMSDKTDTNFIYSSFVSLDIDHADADMNTMVEALEYKPTIAYTSCSDGMEGKHSYRLIYCFADKIEGTEEYYNYVYTLLEANHLSISDIDKRSLKGSQYYNGNGCGSIDIKRYDIVYNKSDFTEYYKDYYSINIIDNNSKSINLTNNTTPSTIISYNDTFVNKDFENDYWNMKMEDVLVKYIDVYPNLEHTPLPTVDEDTPYIEFPSDYIEIKRYWKIRNDGRAAKIEDGHHRRKNLFINGIIRRMINPSITFDNLVYNLLFELVNYISNFNADYTIDKKDIYYIARNVMKADLSRGEGLKGADRRFMVNPKYCEKYGVNKKQARNMACKMLRDRAIGELYDCSLNDKQNLEVFKKNGLEIAPITLKRWRKDNGITKYKKKAV